MATLQNGGKNVAAVNIKLKKGCDEVMDSSVPHPS